MIVMSDPNSQFRPQFQTGLGPRYNNRVPAPALLSEMQLDRNVRAWKGEQDSFGHQVYAARSKTIELPLQISPLQMSDVWSHLLPPAEMVDSQQVRK